MGPIDGTNVLEKRKIICPCRDSEHRIVENCAFLGYYAARSGNFLPTYRDNCLKRDGTDKLSRNVGKKLPLLAA